MSKPRLDEWDLGELLNAYRPGSKDWSWHSESLDLFTNERQVPITLAVLERVLDEGIGFLDHIAPILLGSDGRIWDGHHRICIAMELGIEKVMVEE